MVVLQKNVSFFHTIKTMDPKEMEFFSGSSCWEKENEPGKGWGSASIYGFYDRNFIQFKQLVKITLQNKTEV